MNKKNLLGLVILVMCSIGFVGCQADQADMTEQEKAAFKGGDGPRPPEVAEAMASHREKWEKEHKPPPGYGENGPPPTAALNAPR